MHFGMGTTPNVADVISLSTTPAWLTTGLQSVNLSTLERRYDLTSVEVAWLPSSYNLASGALGILYGFLATFLHKGRILTAGIGVFIVGCGVYLLPHVLVDNYVIGDELRPDYCVINCKHCAGIRNFHLKDRPTLSLCKYDSLIYTH